MGVYLYLLEKPILARIREKPGHALPTCILIMGRGLGKRLPHNSLVAYGPLDKLSTKEVQFCQLKGNRDTPQTIHAGILLLTLLLQYWHMYNT